MNRYLTCVLLIVFGVMTSQAQAVFQIDSLPQQGVLLDKGWKWLAGDNPDWAKPGFDDSKWDSIDPTQAINNLPQIRKAGLGWLRIHLKIDSALKNRIISIVSDQTIASEFYLDGQLIGKFGIVSSKPENVKAYNPVGINSLNQVIHFYTGTTSEHVLTIRFAVQPIKEYQVLASVTYSLEKITLFLSDDLSVNSQKESYYEKKDGFEGSVLDYFKSGLFFILSILHLFIYFSYRAQKANLYFGIFCFSSFFSLFVQGIVEEYYHYVSDHQNFIKFFWFFYFIQSSIMLRAIYALFFYKISIVYYLLAAFIFIFLVVDLGDISYPFLPPVLLIACIHLDVARVSIFALKNKINGSVLILIGSLSYFIFILAFTYSYKFQFNQILTHLFSNISFISIPISITLFLASEFARTTRSLAIKLVENESLFAEKQHILATQNETLEKQVDQRTAELAQSLNQLKTTQNQLIQKEKLASLGELTAGIAHEIQNPLNFVNNFAEVSVELSEELDQSVDEQDTQLTKELSMDLRQNMQLIAQNGQRASSIVRAMLEHSSISTGERQPTDLNALAEEFLRLTYRGYRAKESTFLATLKTDFDPNLPPLDVVSQDIGRVLLNLYNNAFYAVYQRQLLEDQNPDSSEGMTYEPMVWVSTQQVEGGVELRVKDNGIGIPARIQEKVFQPFFTTKPTGQGTGLGLSLSYDIITKGHGGTLEVQSQPGQFTEFTLTLPLP